MKEINWKSFTVRMDVQAPVEVIYRAWTTRAGLESWFLRKSVFINAGGTIRGPEEETQPGDQYTWMWHGWPDETVEKGEVLACNGKDEIHFTLGKAGNFRVRIYTESGETIVEILQEDIPDDETGKHTFYVGCKTGWTFYLTNLKSVLAGGHDLRNKKPGIGQLLNL